MANLFNMRHSTTKNDYKHNDMKWNIIDRSANIVQLYYGLWYNSSSI